MKKLLAALLAIGVMVFGFAGRGEASPVQWATNGHYYDAVAFPSGITWDEARIFAANSTYLGMNGHLATITSMEENNFIVNSLGGPGAVNTFFLGGFQPASSPEPDGNWQWITGEPWSFSNWDPAEPNNLYSGGGIGTTIGTDEEVLHFYHGNGQWNDVPQSIGWYGLIVEYEPIPIPGAVWLLGSGLMGLVGVRRRLKTNK